MGGSPLPPFSTIPALNPAPALTGAEQAWINQGGIDYRTSLAGILGLAPPGTLGPQPNHVVLAGPTAGGPLPPTYRQLATPDLSDVVPRTTFTPTIAFTTPGDATFAFTTQQGAYVKVGPMVLFWIALAFTPTYTTASGSLSISLPPPPMTDIAWSWPIRNLNGPTFPTGGTDIVARTQLGTPPSIGIVAFVSGSGFFNFGTAQMPSGAGVTINFSGAYF